MNCPCYSACLFIHKKKLSAPETVAWLMSNYCYHRDHMLCARYRLSQTMGCENVPVDLYPSQTILALEILQTQQSGAWMMGELVEASRPGYAGD